MSKIFLRTSLGAFAVAGLVWSAPAAGPGLLKQLHGHVPPATAHLVPNGRSAETNRLLLAIGLPLRDPEALTNLLAQIYDPSSPHFQHYLTPAEFTAHFAPTEPEFQKVVDFAQANGLTVTVRHPNRLILDVAGSVRNIEKAFKVTLRTYRHPKESRTFFAPDAEPAVDSALPILHISGMDNYSVPRPKAHIIPLSQISQVAPQAGSGPKGTYLGADFRTAYVPGTTLTGAGQNVGLVQFDSYFPGDVAAYARAIGLANPPNLVNVPVDGGVPVPGGGNGEVCLDIEMIMSMSPGVSNIYVYQAPNPSPWVDILSQMANDNLARQLSCSWGGGPPDASAEQIFQQMALQGQTFFNAVGDTDAFLEPDNPITFPSDSPNITEVGGTTLTTAAGAVYTSEKVWNWRIPNQNGGEWGSSGGISTDYAIPNWQKGFGTGANHGSATFRNTPDVALTADNVYLISDNGQAGASGGTSAAAPLWAGFTALINQQGALNGRPSVGFLNPTLYALAKTPFYANCFHDVTNSDNTWSGSPTNFFAVPGYDLCTGLGTPAGTNLINALTQTNGGGGGIVIVEPIISAPPPPWGSTLGVMNGSNPNGYWFLFVQDDKPLDVGLINSGWAIALTTANPVGFAADNQLYVTATNLSVVPGTDFSIFYAVTNYGPSASTGVVVSVITPISGVTLVSSNAPLSVVGSTLAWSVGNLPANTGASLSLTFHAATTGIYTNEAQVSATTVDPNPDDDSVATLVTVANSTPPQLTPVFIGGGAGGFQLSVTGSPGQTVVIEASTNLVNWVPVYTNIVPFTYTNTDSANYPLRFYRGF